MRKCTYETKSGTNGVAVSEYGRKLMHDINCPALLICGEKDRAGSCIRYNRAWHKNTGIPIEWIKDAGHNCNTDKPKIVNSLIEKFLNNC